MNRKTCLILFFLLLVVVGLIAPFYSSWSFISTYNEILVSEGIVTTEQKIDSMVSVDSKPYLVVHIGPSKTGTSTIQKDSFMFTDVLDLDSYIYAGRFGDRKIFAAIFGILNDDTCLTQTAAYLSRSTTNTTNTTKASDIPCWKSRMARVRKLDPKHLLISDEAYSYRKHSKQYYDNIKIVFQDWNLLYIVSYRRYGEWILSSIKQKYATRDKCVGEKTIWEEGQRCTNKWSFVRTFLHRKDENGREVFRTNYFNIDESTRGMKEANVSFKIVNFHDERHISSSFYCDAIPNTPNTCRHSHSLNSNKGTAANIRDIMSSTCANIVYDARMAGLLKISNQTRLDMNMECELFMETKNITHADMPLVCPTKEMLEELLEKSLEFEIMILPDFGKSDRGRAEHIKSFWEMANERREFCDVDTEKLLESQSSWMGVLNKTTFKNWTITLLNDN